MISTKETGSNDWRSGCHLNKIREEPDKMEKKKTIFDFLGQILIIYGVTMIIILILSQLVGESAKEISAMFSLGNEGISAATMGQFLLLSVMVSSVEIVFFSEWLAKRWSCFARTVGMLFSMIVIIAVFAVLFKWFPAASWLPWVCFLLCFGACFVVSTLIMRWKARLESRKLEEGLASMRSRWEEEDGKK